MEAVWCSKRKPSCGRRYSRPAAGCRRTSTTPRRRRWFATFLRWSAGAETVCAYVPVGYEPGSIELIDALHRRLRVLLPVARRDATGNPQPLQWGEYRPGELVDARFGLREPAEPWLATDAVAQASVILVPALAVDRGGVRLGRGAGFYDRSLPLADPAARMVAVVRDDELVDLLPAEPHDVRMTHALTPRGGPVALG